MTASSRRAAQLGLGAAVLVFIICVTVIISGSLHARQLDSNAPVGADRPAPVMPVSIR